MIKLFIESASDLAALEGLIVPTTQTQPIISNLSKVSNVKGMLTFTDTTQGGKPLAVELVIGYPEGTETASLPKP